MKVVPGSGLSHVCAVSGSLQRPRHIYYAKGVGLAADIVDAGTYEYNPLNTRKPKFPLHCQREKWPMNRWVCWRWHGPQKFPDTQACSKQPEQGSTCNLSLCQQLVIRTQKHITPYAALLVTNNALCLMSGLVSGIWGGTYCSTLVLKSLYHPFIAKG